MKKAEHVDKLRLAEIMHGKFWEWLHRILCGMEVWAYNLIGIDVMDIDISKSNKIALEADRLILKYYGTEYDVYSKDDRVPVESSLKFCAVAGFAGRGVVDIIGNPMRYNKATLKNENFIAYSNDAIVKGIMK